MSATRVLRRTSSPIAVTLIASILAACAVGPNYRRASVVTPPAFKEAEGWIPAKPADTLDRGAWWSVFDDPELDALERRVATSNQTLAAAEAAYRQAHALVAADRATFFPTVNLTGSATKSGSGRGASSASTTGSRDSTQYQVGLGASWAPDLWGSIRRTVEGAKASAQAQAADVANARLSAQGELALDYFQLRLIDAETEILGRTVAAYAKALEVTQNKYQAGVAARSDVLTAQTQLTTTKASLVDLGSQRAADEHAIAVLAGLAPADLTVKPTTGWSPGTPTTPILLPSTLLQRRPDVAAAERNMANANAQVGVAVAAYFPSLNLTASGGYAATAVNALFNSSNSLWSLGASVSETLLDFGTRHAKVREARAAYDQAVAQYRQTVMTAFQQVEDALAAARVLQAEEVLRAQADQQASQNEQITLNEYRAGQVDYTTVATTQAAALSAHQALITVRTTRATEAVDLIQALGGGWDAAELKGK